ncbi:MAG: protein translocase subunit SecF [Deltaproteobacteria bacterium]|nr:MAG: protein translocase subunit SecF [Deltaproteobacteria bacterium]
MHWIKNWLDSLHIDFIKPWRVFATLSVIAVLSSWVLFFGWPGPQWGIDFQGGTEIHLQFNVDEQGNRLEDAEPVTIEQIREALAVIGLGDDVVQSVGAPDRQEFQIRIRDTTSGSEEIQATILDKLRSAYGEDALGEVKVDAEVGTRMEISFASGRAPPIVEAGEHLADIEGLKVTEGTERGEITVRLPGLADIVLRDLEAEIDRPFRTLSLDAVGPKVGGDLRTQGMISVLITLGLVLVYIAFRFDIAFAPGAILALLHDVSLTLGVFVLLGLEINLPTVGALLTIVGYSLNDTIVIFDRIRENQDRYRRQDLAELINTSINETMTRTVATSVTTFLAVLPFLLFGGSLLPELLGMPSAGDVIWSFAFAMLLGIVFGTYSTVYVASPTILVMQRVMPYLRKLMPDFSDEVDGEEGVGEAALTASARRRQERAEAAKGGGER